LEAGQTNEAADLDASDLDRILDRLVATMAAQGPPRLESPRPSTAVAAIGEPEGDIGRIGRFRLLDELGRGGMGIVYRAWDESLYRVVALKVLRSEQADLTQRRRLVREARLAASFRNDYAVMVLAVIDPDDGLPYLVMEFIDGPTLADLIGSQERPEPQRVASIVAQVADALGAAHAAGLIHRDVKPSNILIENATGRAKITDFGLACAGASTGTMTREGLLGGTPTYMSPEQARGEERVDVRTDIYSLGATFYEALTGQPPFAGAAHAVLRRILDEDPIPPRRLDDTIPRDLETICSKAMAREPSRRYQTTSELGADLRRWLQGEPIHARPAGRMERVALWCRRNPRVARLTASLALVFCAGFGGVFWQWRRAEANLKVARTNFQRARRAVDQFYTRFYEQGLLSVPGLEGARHEVLGEMIQYYKDFIEQHRDDAGARRELVETCVRIGLLTGDAGDRQDAIALLRRAGRDLEQLIRASPGDRTLKDLQLKCLFSTGLAEERVGEAASARATYERGIQILREMIQRDPGDVRLLRRLAPFYGNLANVFFSGLGDKPQARRNYLQALEIQQKLLRQDPTLVTVMSGLAMTYHNLNSVTDDVAERQAFLEQALQLRKQLVALEPSNNYFRRNLGRTLQFVGLQQCGRGRPAQGLELLEESRRILEQVVVAQPGVTEYQADLGQTLENLGNKLAEQARRGDAQLVFVQAQTIFQKLVHSHPEDHTFGASLRRIDGIIASFQKPTNESRPASASPGPASALH